jgi:hypothetical protein
MAFQFDSDRLRKRIQEALGKIYTEVDPTLLNKYRKVIKKEVSFFRRSYLTAYLLMEQEQRGGPSARKPFGDGSRNEREDRRDRENRPRRTGNPADDGPRRTDPNGYPLADEDSVRLFFSVGRSRRVFPREILGLVISKTSVSRDDVGAIRILDNYSFVQVRNTVADEIIEALNGKPFRGRPLSVNYARARKDAADQRSVDQRSVDQRSVDQRSIDQGSATSRYRSGASENSPSVSRFGESEDSSADFSTDLSEDPSGYPEELDSGDDEDSMSEDKMSFDDEPDFPAEDNAATDLSVADLSVADLSADEPSYGEDDPSEDGSSQDDDDHSDEKGV